jgi:hypothetical protein
MKPKLSINIFLFLCISSLVACGGSGGGGDDFECFNFGYNPACVDSLAFPTNYSFPPPDPNTNITKILSGMFIDSAVEGLRFETPTQSGFTDANGIFKYINGEAVSFFILYLETQVIHRSSTSYDLCSHSTRITTPITVSA